MIDERDREHETQMHRKRIEIFRRMTPEQRLNEAFALSEFVNALFRHGLRKLHPGLPEEEFHQLYLKHLEKCHNRNY